MTVDLLHQWEKMTVGMLVIDQKENGCRRNRKKKKRFGNFSNFRWEKIISFLNQEEKCNIILIKYFLIIDNFTLNSNQKILIKELVFRFLKYILGGVVVCGGGGLGFAPNLGFGLIKTSMVVIYCLLLHRPNLPFGCS